jgi:hypothetical protein
LIVIMSLMKSSEIESVGWAPARLRLRRVLALLLVAKLTAVMTKATYECLWTA